MDFVCKRFKKLYSQFLNRWFCAVSWKWTTFGWGSITIIFVKLERPLTCVFSSQGNHCWLWLPESVEKLAMHAKLDVSPRMAEVLHTFESLHDEQWAETVEGIKTYFHESTATSVMWIRVCFYTENLTWLGWRHPGTRKEEGRPQGVTCLAKIDGLRKAHNTAQHTGTNVCAPYSYSRWVPNSYLYRFQFCTALSWKWILGLHFWSTLVRCGKVTDEYLLQS